jgi:invasion protein IalB
MNFGTRIWALLASFAVVVILVSGSAMAAESELLSEHEDWAAYTYENDKEGKVCYAVSQPKESEPKNVRRDPIFFLVTNRPARKVVNEVSVIIGYPFKKNSDATVDIGSDSFSLFTSSDGAWVKDGDDERRLVAAMKRGAKMTVKGSSWRGTRTSDEFSLSGISAALDAIDGACK